MVSIKTPPGCLVANFFFFARESHSLGGMNALTRLLAAVHDGQPAAAELLPLVDTELRRLAVAKMVRENPGFTKRSRCR